MPNEAQTLFEAKLALDRADDAVYLKLKEIFNKSMEFGHDYYDGSIELYNLPNDFTMTQAQDEAIRAMGFQIIFCNYVKNGGNFTPAMNAMPVIKEVENAERLSE